jgi:rhodanese-related sulfurtransferase
MTSATTAINLSRELVPVDVKGLRRRPGLIIDIRSASAFGAGSIPGAENIPDSKTTALVHRVSKGGPVVLVCEDGSASHQAAKSLRFCGFANVSYLAGGLRAWLAAHPSGSEPAQPVAAAGALPSWRRAVMMISAAVLLTCAAFTVGRLCTDGTLDTSVHEATPPGEPHDAPPPEEQ